MMCQPFEYILAYGSRHGFHQGGRGSRVEEAFNPSVNPYLSFPCSNAGLQLALSSPVAKKKYVYLFFKLKAKRKD